MSETPHTDRLAQIQAEWEMWPPGVSDAAAEIRWLLARVRELEAELSRYRAQGGLTPTYASGSHPPNLQGCTQERDNG